MSGDDRSGLFTVCCSASQVSVLGPIDLVAHRIQYRVVLLMLMVHDNRYPLYLSESVQPVSSNPVRQRLRSASSLDYIVPRTRTKFGDRAFSAAGPTVFIHFIQQQRTKRPLTSRDKIKYYNTVHAFILAYTHHRHIYIPVKDDIVVEN